MSTSSEAYITPSVLKWAREKAGFHDVKVAAQKIGRTPEELTSWENGSGRPTIAQARKIAEVYKRSLAVFYLPEPPKGFETLRDFRRLRIDQPREYSTKLSVIIRLAEYRKKWLSEWMKAEGSKELDFIGSVTTNTSPNEIAGSIRNALGISIRDQIACSTRRDALNLWIRCVEFSGINVMRDSSVDLSEARGFVLSDPFSPFLFLNSKDALAGQIFTLVHELVHLWLNQPGIMNLNEAGHAFSTTDDIIEVFCNRVTSLVLIDETEFSQSWKLANSNSDIDARIREVSDKYKVSEELIARRLLELQIISQKKYLQLRAYFQERWKQLIAQDHIKRKDTDGGPSPHLLRVLKNGRPFTSVVLTSYFQGQISSTEASSLLSAKVNNFEKLSAYLRVPQITLSANRAGI